MNWGGKTNDWMSLMTDWMAWTIAIDDEWEKLNVFECEEMEKEKRNEKFVI